MGNLKVNRRSFLKHCSVFVIALGAVSPFARSEERKLYFWSSVLSDPRYKQQYVPWFREQVKKKLPDFELIIEGYDYDEMQSKFFAQVISNKPGIPDILEGVLEQVPIYQTFGMIAPLTAAFNDWKEHQEFIPSFLEGFKFKGELWAMPYSINARGLVYRMPLLAKYKLDVPKTWDDLLKASSKITAGEKDVPISGYIIATQKGAVRVFQEFISHVFQLSDHVFAFNKVQSKWEVQITLQQLDRVFRFYHDLFFTGDPPAIPLNLRGMRGNKNDENYTKGKHAMTPTGSFIFGRRQEGPDQRQILENETGIAFLPTPPRGRQKTYLEISPVLLNAFSEHPAEAFEVIKIFTSAESIVRLQMLGGDISPRRDTDDPPLQRQFLDPLVIDWLKRWKQILPSGAILEFVDWLRIREELYDLVEEVVYNQTSHEEAASRLYKILLGEADRFNKTPSPPYS
ncbi:extracellular solute-binding protein [Candidatus Acetothermia bacterium]|nr:extracellular solute-binding protein [Candidatus Acetothermia bacterium]